MNESNNPLPGSHAVTPTEAARHDAVVAAQVQSEREVSTGIAPGSLTNAPLAATPDLAVTGTGTGDNRDETADSTTGAALGGVGGMVVGAIAGSMLGPAGAVAGAVIGGLTGAGASGLAVDAVDQVDDDRTLLGLDGGTADALEADALGTPQTRLQEIEASRTDERARAEDSSLIV